MVSTFRKKPLIVNAILFDGSNFDEILAFGNKEGKKRNILKNSFTDEQDYLFIRTLEGNMKVSEGDYVIQGVQGEFYPCKRDIFNSTYDKVVPVKRIEEGKEVIQYINVDLID